jgi:hypothetical protein
LTSARAARLHAGNGLNGGAFAVLDRSTLELTDTTISHCTAWDMGGAVYASHTSTVTLTNVHLSNCVAWRGGALAALQYSQVHATRSSFAHSRAEYVPGVAPRWLGGRQSSVGGALLLHMHSTGIMDESSIDRCSAEAGGAIATTRYSTLHLRSSVVTHCAAQQARTRGSNLHNSRVQKCWLRLFSSCCCGCVGGRC